jgi:hypothetical protein
MSEHPERRPSDLPDLDHTTPGWGRARLAELGADQVEAVGFANAPGAFRSKRLPVEVREGFADLWDAVAAEVVDFVAINGAEALRTKAGRKRLWRRLERVLQLSQLVTIRLGYTYPLPTGRWAHRALGTGGSGAVAAVEQAATGLAVVSGPTSSLVVATVGAAMTEMLEVYVATSARVERYRHAARTPSFETISTDVGALYGAKGLGSRPAERRIAEEAMRAMLKRVIRRSQWRFGEMFVPLVGPVIAGGMTATVVTRAQGPALREPDAIERGG